MRHTRDLGQVLVFGLGLAAVAWVAAGYLGSNPLALAMTGLIAATYLAGAAELRRFQQATQGLQTALDALPTSPPVAPTDSDEPAPVADLHPLSDWLGRLHPSLQRPVRLRIEGERLPLPGPALTPYLVGLLVLLGMLGTFLGLVVTLQGTVLALQGSTDLASVRQALAAPVQGLGLAFGTSVAGVAASAMLGLLSALCRRSRLQATQRLDSLAARHLHGLSRAHQREQSLATLQALQMQTAPLLQLPQVLDQLQALARQTSAQAQASQEQLLRSQDSFQHQTLARTQALAEAIDLQVKQALQGAAQLAGATLQPLLQDSLAGMDRQVQALQQGVTQTLHQQLQAQAAAFERQQAQWLERLARSQSELQAQAATADEQRLAHWNNRWTAAADQQQQAWQRAWEQAGAQTQSQHAEICRTLAQTAQALQAQAHEQGRDTLAELSRLAASAAQAPQAAAELLGVLRQQSYDNLAQDQQQWAQRSELMARLHAVLDGLDRQAEAQRQASAALLSAATRQLQQAGDDLQARVAADTDQLATAAAHISSSAAALSTSAADVGASAVDLASLSEGFAAAVQMFGQSSSALGTQLQQIETALNRSTARSDEQLAYYVAQAREIIDLSISSQQQIVQDLRQLAQPRPARLETTA